MDRRRAFARFLSAAAPAVFLAGAADAPSLPIAESRWLAPDALNAGLSREPAECLVQPSDPGERRSAAIGRVAFRAPLLLGGQAARAGLSCASCHRNGRGNPAFLFPGLSGSPGTADVTSSMMSSHRGDGTVNPKPIPDLGGPRAKLKISQEREDGALESFIRGLIVEEFDGPPPPPTVLRGLAAYVRALRPEGCGPHETRVTLREKLAQVAAALTLARGADPPTRRLLIGAARSTLGTIDERFHEPGLEADRSLLRQADFELREIRDERLDFAVWDRRWPWRRRVLLRDGRRSLFDPDRLERALSQAATAQKEAGVRARAFRP